MKVFLFVSIISMSIFSAVNAAHAAGPITIRGLLLNDAYHRFTLMTPDADSPSIVYDLRPAGNTCGQMLTNGALENAVGAIVELTGEELAVPSPGAPLEETFSVMTFPDGERVHVISAAPSQSINSAIDSSASISKASADCSSIQTPGECNGTSGCTWVSKGFGIGCWPSN